MTEEMEKRLEEIRKMSGPDYFGQIQLLLSAIDTLKEENKEFREGDFNAALKNTLKKKTP